jgi:hypothetical protein
MFIVDLLCAIISVPKVSKTEKNAMDTTSAAHYVEVAGRWIYVLMKRLS